jgi:DNA-binding CsgD family transcriptional regulator
MNAAPSLDVKSVQAVYALWDELAAFPAGEIEAALRHLFGWLGEWVGADNVIWIGSVRILRGAGAKRDPFCGWRLRTRFAMHPDSKEYAKLRAAYYNTEHYAKAAITRPEGRDRNRALLHSGMTGRAMMALAGKFRVHRLRDGWVDFATFEKTEHYDRYYRDQGISDRMHVGFPLNADAESIFMIDRRKPGGRGRATFTDREAAMVEMALRGIREFHRRLFLDRGLLMGATPLTALQQRIVRGLLTKMTEKELALEMGQQPRTLHKYVTSLYARYGVKGRTGLMALWLGQS